MAKVYAIINQKGGVGKTTTAFNMGAEIANKGYKVLLMDMDPQGSLTISMGFDAPNVEKTISDLFEAVIRRVAFPEMADYILKRGNLDLIPANLSLSVADTLIVQATSREYILKKIIAKISEDYDYIIIDCPPTLGMLVVNVLTAADALIVPIKASEMDAKGFETLLDTVLMIKQDTNPNLYIEGVLMTMFDKRLIEARETFASLARICPDYGIKIFNAKIEPSTKASGAFRERKTLKEYSEESKLAISYRNFVTEVLNEQ